VKRTIRTTAALLAAGLVASGLALVGAAPANAATSNPILGDGTYYSADPATLVVDDTLYIYAGRDEASATQNDFIMNEWQAFSTTDVDSGSWEHHPALMRPEAVFDWATPGRAYAGQVVEGGDGRYYWYVPVHEAASTSEDKFGIGVAVSDNPLGPWTDHAGGPIVSQQILGNTIHNIDPTVFVDDDGTVQMYWGSFGQARRIELDADMKTLVGTAQTVTGLTGFFEAPWLFERNGTYYMAYAGNNVGSTCTPANYHACIGYASAPSATGPWTYRGTVLAPVSSTTSHPAITEFDGEWVIAYHTADAVGGNHFRRSVAIDTVEWDDTQTPARMKLVTQTPEKQANTTPRTNVAPWAQVTVSNDPVPTQYWVKALNDEIVRPNPLPPDMWGSWTGNRPAEQWLQYTWPHPVRISSTELKFFRDVAPGTGNGVSNPASWTLQYWKEGAWVDVPNPSGYGTSTTSDAVTTTQVRAVLKASPGTANPTEYSALAVEEWKVNAAPATGYTPAAVSTLVGELPELPETVDVSYADGVTLPATVAWSAVDAADVAAPGTFTVSGSAQGYAASPVEVTVTVLGGDELRTNVALDATATASYTAPWNAVGGLNDGTEPTASGDVTPNDNAQVWGAWPQVGAQTIEYEWAGPVRIDESALYFVHNLDASGAGIAVPKSWTLEYWDAGTEAWVALANPSSYKTEVDTFNTVTFDAVTTTRLRAQLVAQGTEEGRSSLGVKEWTVLGEPADVVAPTISLTVAGSQGAAGWYLSNATVRATAVDDRDIRSRIELKTGSGEWKAFENVRFAETLVSAEGATEVRARATDAAGNVSGESLVTVAIDKTLPTAQATVDADARQVTVTAADAGSGLAAVSAIEYSVDNQLGWQAYTTPVVVDEQKHDVYYRARDAAGNVSAAGKATVPISSTVPLTGNIAPLATATASFSSSWTSVGAINDGAADGSTWGTWPEVGEQWVQFTWDRIVDVDSSELKFFSDQPEEAGAGVIVPRSWRIQYLDVSTGQWLDVDAAGEYGRDREAFNPVSFETVSTTALRAVMQAWGETAAGGSSGIYEWRVFAAEAVEPEPDVVAPTVVLEQAPVPPASGWNTGDVTVSVAASDDVDAAPAVSVRVDSGEWAEYTAPIVVSAQGSSTVSARAVDAAGNVSDVGSVSVKLDSVAPVSSAVTADSALRAADAVDGPVTGTPDEPVRLSISAIDETSGVARTEYSTSGEEWLAVGDDAIVFDEVGVQTLSFRSVDVAGNVEQTRTLEVRIAAAEVPVGPEEPGLPGQPAVPGAPTVPAGSSSGGGSGVSSGGTLAATGAEPVLPTLAGLLLLAAGALLLRRRRPAATAPVE
jgi:LPXTG-motif cell wall-anchored protein